MIEQEEFELTNNLQLQTVVATIILGHPTIRLCVFEIQDANSRPLFFAKYKFGVYKGYVSPF